MNTQNIYFSFELTKRDFKERFAGSMLGSLWTFIFPLVNLLIYIIIFGQLMGSKLPGKPTPYSYCIYLCAGLIPWTSFSSILSRSCTVFIDKRNIISKINISLISFVLFIIFSETITFVISFILFFIFLTIINFNITALMIISIFFIYILMIVFLFSISLFSATITVFFRDLKEVTTILIQLWFWFTPIVYVIDIVPESLKNIMVFNPSYIFIDAFQHIILYDSLPILAPIIYLSVISFLILFFAILFFKSLEKDLRDFL